MVCTGLRCFGVWVLVGLRSRGAGVDGSSLGRFRMGCLRCFGVVGEAVMVGALVLDGSRSGWW